MMNDTWRTIRAAERKLQRAQLALMDVTENDLTGGDWHYAGAEYVLATTIALVDAALMSLEHLGLVTPD